jgi:hypothetical protein
MDGVAASMDGVAGAMCGVQTDGSPAIAKRH